MKQFQLKIICKLKWWVFYSRISMKLFIGNERYSDNKVNIVS